MNINQPTGIEAQICADIAARQRIGIAKYGMTLAQNDLELLARLQHAYEECLDQACYLKWAMEKLPTASNDCEET